MNLELFEGRKRDHIRYSLDKKNQANGLSGLGSIRLVHEALPERALSEIDLTSQSFGRSFPTPFFVCGMTAGHEEATELNLLIARTCVRRGWAMGVGSQRREFEAGGSIDRWERLREDCPGLFLISNIGATQIAHFGVEKVKRIIDSLGADAVAVHLNALQEALQPEGTPNFGGARKCIADLCEISSVPVILKETGCGFSAQTLKKISGIGLKAVDVSGLGGTHWGRIEGARSEENSILAVAAETFAEWGVPTALSLLNAREALASTEEIWASGGVRTGLDAAKCIALGAHRVGFAQPVLKAALEGEKALDLWMEKREYELRVAIFCTGVSDPAALRGNHSVWQTT